MADYSNISLKDTLGLKEGMSTYFLRAPSEYFAALGKRPQPYDDIEGEYDFIHAFFDNITELDNFAEILLSKRAAHSVLWVSLAEAAPENDVSAVLSAHGLMVTKHDNVVGRQSFQLQAEHQ